MGPSRGYGHTDLDATGMVVIWWPWSVWHEGECPGPGVWAWWAMLCVTLDRSRPLSTFIVFSEKRAGWTVFSQAWNFWDPDGQFIPRGE